MSRKYAYGVGGWLQSHFRAGVSQKYAGGVGDWLRSLFRAGVSRKYAGGVGAGCDYFLRLVCYESMQGV